MDYASTLEQSAKPLAVQKYPIGYPLQAAFQSSESSWSIYRAFNYLHARVMLDLQEDLRGLESKLTKLDQVDLEKGIRSRRDDMKQVKEANTESERATLLEKIRVKLISYG